MANFFRLLELRDELMNKSDKSRREEQLLKELISLGSILNKSTHSLSLSDGVCPSCGREL